MFQSGRFMIDDVEKKSRNVDIPADVAEAWAAVLVSLDEQFEPATVSDGALARRPTPSSATRNPIEAAQMQRIKAPRKE